MTVKPGEYISYTVEYDTTNVTLCGLIATKTNVYGSSTYGEPQNYLFSDGPVRSTGIDLADGAWGWPTGGVFAGTVSVAVNTASNRVPIPVGYAVVGTCETAAIISLGGASISVSGSFDCTIAGYTNGASISMTTTGAACIGIIPMGTNQWFSKCDGVGDVSGLTPQSSIQTNAGFYALTWIATPQTNIVIMRWSKFGQMIGETNVWPLTLAGYIRAGSQMRIAPVHFWGAADEEYRAFGFLPICGPMPTEAQFEQMEIDARDEYTKRGWGQ